MCGSSASCGRDARGRQRMGGAGTRGSAVRARGGGSHVRVGKRRQGEHAVGGVGGRHEAGERKRRHRRRTKLQGRAARVLLLLARRAEARDEELIVLGLGHGRCAGARRGAHAHVEAGNESGETDHHFYAQDLVTTCVLPSRCRTEYTVNTSVFLIALSARTRQHGEALHSSGSDAYDPLG